jgi:hypothetical protein
MESWLSFRVIQAGLPVIKVPPPALSASGCTWLASSALACRLDRRHQFGAWLLLEIQQDRLARTKPEVMQVHRSASPV